MTYRLCFVLPLQTSASFRNCGAFYGAAELGIALAHWHKTALGDGFHHVAGSSPEAVRQLHDRGERANQERLQEEPVRPQEQLHPQEEHQQEEKPPLWRPEGAGLVAQVLPGRAEKREVGPP